MRLNAPKQVTFWIAVVLVVLALLSLVAIPAVADYAFWLVLIGFIVLALGTLLENF